MLLSEKEGKYRTKFIQEHHYDKFGQKQLDMAKKDLNFSYKQIYLDVEEGFVYTFMAAISINRASKAMSKVGMSFKQATDCMATFERVLPNSKYSYI